MSGDDDADSKSGNDSNPTTKPTSTKLNKQKPNRLKIKACDLEIEAESHTENVEEMMEILAPEMEEVMEYHLVGDMAAIEERDLFAEIFGGSR